MAGLSTKRICPAVQEIIRQLRVKLDKAKEERFIYRMHVTLYHRPAKDFDKDVEYCKVFNQVCDPISWEEVLRLATASS